MYKISGKQEYGAFYLDGKCAVEFVRGVGTTNDSAVADLCKAKGYKVEGEPDVVDPFAGMKVKDLKAYAEENGIDIPAEANTKAEILAVLQAAITATPDPNANPDE